MAEKINPGWTLVLKPEEMVRFEDHTQYSEHERNLPEEEFAKIVLLKLWWEKIKLELTVHIAATASFPLVESSLVLDSIKELPKTL